MSNGRPFRFVVLGFVIIAISAISVTAGTAWGDNLYSSIREFFGTTSSAVSDDELAVFNGPIIFQRGLVAGFDFPFYRGGSLYKVDPDSGAETLFGDGSQPNFTADGSKIVFTLNSQIARSPTGTYTPTGLTILGGGSAITGFYPKWSPDSLSIAYNTSNAATTGTLYYHIKILGGSCSACDIGPELNLGAAVSNLYPGWSPAIGTSGTSRTAKIVYVQTTATRTDILNGNYNGDLVSEAITIAPNGTVTDGPITNLTRSPAQYAFPTYSHDGTKIAYVNLATATGNNTLNVMNAADGSNSTVLVTFPNSGDRYCHHPAWSPDDTKIAFSDTNQIFQVTTATQAVSQISNTAASANDLSPSWAPGTSAPPTPTPSPSPIAATLSFDGRLRDRVSKSDAGIVPDGESDGTFSLTLPPVTASKSFKSIVLTGPTGNEWDTIPQTSNIKWVVGIADTLDRPLFNCSDGSLTCNPPPVGNPGTFKLFIGDSNPTSLTTGKSFTVTVTFTDNTTAVGSTTINKTQADLEIRFNPLSNPPPTSVPFGQSAIYSILVNNNGPEKAFGAFVQGNMPSGTVLDSNTSSFCVSTGLGGAFICDLGEIDPGPAHATSGSSVRIMTIGFRSFAVQQLVIRPSVFLDDSKSVDNVSSNNTVSVTTSVNPNVELNGLEVTQGVQDMNNDMPLVAGRATYVRAHVTNLSSGAVAASATLTAKNAVTGAALGSIKNSNKGGSINLLQNPQRSELDDSFYFEIPNGTFLGQPDWTTGQVEFTFSGNEFPFACHEKDGTTDCKVSVKFKPQRTFSLKLLLTTFTDSAGNSFTPTSADAFETVSEIVASFPMAKFGNLTLDTWSIKQQYCTAGVKNATTGVVNENGIGKVLTALKNKRAADCGPDLAKTGKCKAGVEDFYIALVPLSGVCSSMDATGLADTNLDVDGIKTDNSGNSAIAAVGVANTRTHELGHNFGLRHTCATKDSAGNFIEAGCGTVVPADGTMSVGKEQFGLTTYYGFDPYRETITGLIPAYDSAFGYIDHGRVYGPNSPDMMSYGRADWVSAYNFSRLFNVLVTNSTSKEAREDVEGREQVMSDKLMMIDGSVSATNGPGEIGSVYVTDQSGTVTLPDPGTYAVRLADAQGGQLASYSFEPTVSSEGSDRNLFSLLLPWDNSAKRIELLKNGQVIATRQASANPPTVQVSSPNGGETLNGQSATFAWNAADADQDVLTYAVDYSTDAGTSWRSLAMNWPSKTYTVDLSKLPGSTQGLIRVTATDGFNTVQDQSNAVFTIPPHGAQVFIVTPTNNAIYVGDQAINLSGMGIDTKDGLLDGSKLTWSSNLNGVLGTGSSLIIPASGLVEGTHTITLAASNSSGLTANLSLMIQVFRTRPVFPATLKLDSTAISFDPKTSSQTIPVRNTGDGNLTWTATADQPWIKLSPASGDGTTNVDVTIIPGGLPFGNLTGKITFTSPEAINGPQVVNVNLSMPQGATASLSGKVLTSDGRGLRNSTVTLTNSVGVTRSATTSSFGFFSFSDVAVGETYTIRIGSRSYRFASRTMQIISDLALADFVGLE